MNNDGSHDDQLAQRKAVLLRQAEFYRVGIVHSRAAVTHSLQPASLIHSAVEHASGVIHARIDAMLAPTGLSLQTVLPYALSGAAFVVRRRLVKPLLLAGAVVSALALYLSRRRARLANAEPRY